ncbi:hypothetical protein OOK41_16305 [Micromonospora sp. NBC_01655]|uniref:hypothetical protein n=1 Tax=Micromonospora sp. NBC_01655 TaxID=2975983 RepID=UPI002250BC72|nr:hypothetical protein [Micromonospora sp. NBC_01655]MCX4471852.1 hypothetical protein [Micromonospora sp. NBC_01655]
MSDIVDVLRLWLDGKPTSDVVIWGHSMLIWGRVGKTVQLVAGGVVVLDLLNPAWFRRCGTALQNWSSLLFRRSNERRALRQIVRLREEVGWDFLHNRSFATGPTSAVTWVVLVAASPARVPDGLGLNLDAYRAYHRQVIDHVMREHTCTDPRNSTCGKLQEYVWRRVDELVEAQRPPNERHLVERAKEAEIGGYGALVGSAIGMVILFAGIAKEDLRLAVPGALLIPLSWSWRVRLTLSTLSHRLLGGLQRAVGRDLHEPRPLIWLRWLAFLSLIFGTVLDLLAS